MSYGMPVIVSNCGSLTEIVNCSGIIVQQNNIDELAKAMEYVIDEVILMDLSERSMEIAKEFSLDFVAEKWRILIEKTKKR